ncbi:MAG TPA: hypothetical protein VF875_05820 [Anaeromyxobacter sp.]
MQGNETLRRVERRWRCAARTVAAIALAATATASWAAAPKTASATSAKAASSSSASASSTALAAKPPPAKPPPAQPTSVATAPAFVGGDARWLGVSMGMLSAFDVGDSLAVRLDYGVLRTPPSWRRFDLEWHLVVGLSTPSGKTELKTNVVPPGGTTAVEVSAGQEKVSAFLLEIVPTARVLFSVTRGVAFFADGGLGLCQSFESYERSEMFEGNSTRKEYATGFVVHTALGMAADLTPRWRLLLVPVAFSFQLGPKFSGFTPSFGLAYRL